MILDSFFLLMIVFLISPFPPLSWFLFCLSSLLILFILYLFMIFCDSLRLYFLFFFHLKGSLFYFLSLFLIILYLRCFLWRFVNILIISALLSLSKFMRPFVRIRIHNRDILSLILWNFFLFCLYQLVFWFLADFLPFWWDIF